MPETITAPFPYFGGKTAVAPLVWKALGDCRHYIEPFFGSGAVLLARPDYRSGESIETICDKDGFVANVWRALQFDPDTVARWCDWPVNHADLSARKKKLIENETRLLENLIADPEWFDAKLAGYWVWAASCWIGSGLTSIGQIPRLSDAGIGVHTLGQIPHVGTGGMGVHRLGQRPDAPNTAAHVQEPYNDNIYSWFRRLAERLRYVRIVCGDWTRVCGGNWQDNMGTVGLFFDPPYGVEHRDADVYHCDSTTIARDVEAWCLERGKIGTYRIVVAGYEREYLTLEAAGWRKHEWKGFGGYANTAQSEGNRGKDNRKLERLWFSPHCLGSEKPQAEMF